MIVEQLFSSMDQHYSSLEVGYIVVAMMNYDDIICYGDA